MSNQYNNYEILLLAKENDEIAKEYIYQKYSEIIKRKAQKFIPLIKDNVIEENDIIQEGMLALEQAINEYDEQSNSSFYTFAILCINRKLLNYMRKANQPKNTFNQHNKNHDFLSTKEGDYLETSREYINVISPENDLLEEEAEIELYNKIRNRISKLEEVVFELKIQGYTYKEIANIMDKDIKIIYNAMERIKLKAQKILENSETL